MAKLSLKKGTTSYLARIFLQDSSSTTGAGLAGLTSGSASLVCYRARDDDGNAAGTAISLSGGTRGTWSSGGFVEKDATNMPGVYEFGIPNAALATGSNSVLIMFKGATNLAPLPLEIELTGWDNQDAIHGGMSALPNTACSSNASLITSGSSTDQLSVSSGNASADVKKINAVATTSVTTVNANVGTTQPTNFTGTAGSALVKSDMVDVAGSAVSATTAQLGVNVVNWNNTVVATPATAGIPDVNVKNMNNVSGAAITTIKAVQGLTTADTIVTVSGNVNGSVGSVTGAVGSVTGAVGSVTGAVGSVTGNVGGNVTGSVGSVVGAVGSVTGNVGGNVTGSVGSVVGAVGSVTGNVGGNVTGSVASVLAGGLVDLTTTTYAESSGVPAATASLKDKLIWLATVARNKLTQTSTTQLVRNDGDSATVGTSTVSDDGTTFTRGKFS